MKKFLRLIAINKNYILIFLLLFFLIFSFFPTIFELSKANKLYDQNREFILEHNYYWPDFNLYLSKIRQGWQGRFTALERYTSEPHRGSLIQEFYVVLGLIGRILGLDPNFSYQLGRLILSPLLLIIIIFFVTFYFKEPIWQILSFSIVMVSGSFPRFFQDQGIWHTGRFMEWWSNIDALQRITFIPHILFGQVVSFFILYELIAHNFQLDRNKIILLIILANLAGIVFPPSLVTLEGVIVIYILLKLFSQIRHIVKVINYSLLIFLLGTFPSLIYILFITKITPWSALIDFHRNHPMMIPLDQYILGTGPIFFLGFAGSLVSIIKKDKKLQPLIFWIIANLLFAVYFSIVKEQSPLRFTQTGLFIPLGILGAYFFQQLSLILNKRIIFILVAFYILENLYMMKVSLSWQTTFMSQRAAANIPAVPYPPQTLYPLKDWMNGIRWLGKNTNPESVVLAEITAGNFIPAYAGNTVYFGQSNTVDYDKKQLLVDKFFSGAMSSEEAKNFLITGRINYIFFSVQEKEKSSGKTLDTYYPFLKPVFNNSLVTIYRFES